MISIENKEAFYLKKILRSIISKVNKENELPSWQILFTKKQNGRAPYRSSEIHEPWISR